MVWYIRYIHTWLVHTIPYHNRGHYGCFACPKTDDHIFRQGVVGPSSLSKLMVVHHTNTTIPPVQHTSSLTSSPPTMSKPIVYHIPACPFCQRLEILLALKGQSAAIQKSLVDLTTPRDPELLRKTRGTTSLPVLETNTGSIIKESLIILNYLDETVQGGLIRRKDPTEHAIESMLIAKEGPFTLAGYFFVMNQNKEKRRDYENKLLMLYRELNDFLLQHSPQGTFLFDSFGLAETVFTPIFQRFWFLEYYEDFRLPNTEQYQRVALWKKACEQHPLTQQVTREDIIKIYYDYAKGSGNGALLPGRKFSSFALHSKPYMRPMPPKDKYDHTATDEELGLWVEARNECEQRMTRKRKADVPTE